MDGMDHDGELMAWWTDDTANGWHGKLTTCWCFGNIVLTLCTGSVIHLSSFTLSSSSRATLFLAPAFCFFLSSAVLHLHYCLGKPHRWTVDYDISALHHELRLKNMSAQTSQWCSPIHCPWHAIPLEGSALLPPCWSAAHPSMWQMLPLIPSQWKDLLLLPATALADGSHLLSLVSHP